MNSTISACLIVKDEEKHIKRCLESIKNLVDEIIVVDTGSIDETMNIAKQMGAKVYEHQWENDFSKARNVSLEKATMDWILFIDADEEIDEKEVRKIKDILKGNANYNGFYVKILNIEDGKCTYEAVSVRLFKNNSKYKFAGKLHEQIANCIQGISGVESIKQTDIVFYHYGYDGNLSDLDKKNKRNINILESYPEEEKDSYYYFALGNEYGKIDENKKALEAYIKSINNMDSNDRKCAYYPSLIMNIVKVMNNEKRFNDMISFIKKVRNTVPDYKDLYFMEFVGRMECGKYSRAKECLEEYINCNVEQNYHYPSNHFDIHNDIEAIRKELKNLSIRREEENISVIITVEKDYENLNYDLMETVKSVNEIGDDIIVVCSESINLDIQSILNLRVQVIQIPEEIVAQNINVGINASKGEYIIMLDVGILLSTEINNKIIAMIEANKLVEISDINNKPIKVFAKDEYNVKFYKYMQYLQEIGEVEVLDEKIKFNYNGINFEFIQLDEIEIFFEIFINKQYEIPINRECIVIDIGANVGVASIYFANNPYVRKVYSYEPFELTYSLLTNNLKLNPILKNKIEANNWGLGNSDKIAYGVIDETLKGNSRIIDQEGEINQYKEYKGNNKIEKVEIKRVSTVLRKLMNEYDEIDIILKIDCEGGEVEILKDEQFIEILEHIETVVMETHAPEIFIKICNMLKSKGFNVQGNMISSTKGYIKAIKNCG